MHKLNVVLVASLLAAAAVLGTVAATRTAALGSGSRHSADASVRVRAAQLDRFEASLRKALAKRPPALPAVPKLPAAPAAPAAAPQQRVIYRRPPAIVVVKHTHHGDDGGHDGGGGGGDD